MSDRQSTRCSHTPPLTPHCTGSRWRTASLQMRLQQAEANYGPRATRSPMGFLIRSAEMEEKIIMLCFMLICSRWTSHLNKELHTEEREGQTFCFYASQDVFFSSSAVVHQNTPLICSCSGPKLCPSLGYDLHQCKSLPAFFFFSVSAVGTDLRTVQAAGC